MALALLASGLVLTRGIPLIEVHDPDLREIAYEHRKTMPTPVRILLRGIGGKGASGSRLLSFLLFESKYTRDLIELGYHDAMKVRDQLEAFIRGDDVPRLFAPRWVSNDLTGRHPILRLTDKQ